MKVKIIKKFEIMPGKFLIPTGNVITIMDKAAYRAIKQGCAISIDKPELNPVKPEIKKVKIKNKKEE